MLRWLKLLLRSNRKTYVAMVMRENGTSMYHVQANNLYEASKMLKASCGGCINGLTHFFPLQGNKEVEEIGHVDTVKAREFLVSQVG